MKKYIALVLCCLLLPVQVNAGKKSEGQGKKPPLAGKKPDIVVMTQNQYFGADFAPIIEADGLPAYNAAVIAALQSVIGNNLPERAMALAESISERKPHLVGLQEIFQFTCIPVGDVGLDGCSQFSAAFGDHLTATLDALNDLGEEYYVAGEVKNLDISPATFGPFGLLGLPVFWDNDQLPDMFITVLDRDVILARADVSATFFEFPCGKPSLTGCNFGVVASTTLELAGTSVKISVERGFVGVDAVIGGDNYRFVNTHLEVRALSAAPESAFFQAAQSAQLIGTALSVQPTDSRLIIVGDINSSPLDEPFDLPLDAIPPFPCELAYPPYQQLAEGKGLCGEELPIKFSDSWNLRPGKPPGNTCCQLADLSNAVSMHDERIDVIFAWPAPARVKANVLDNDPDDKTLSGLWPSDHSSVVARLYYED